MFFTLDTMGGGNLILPLLCVLGLAFGTLVTGTMAAGKESPFRIRIFWITMAAFLFATALLLGRMSHWAFSLVLLLPAILFLFLFQTGKKGK